MRLFVSVVDEAAISRAARREGIAASAVSKRISELEQRLGVTLLTRHCGGIEITPAGAAFLRRARNLLREIGQIQGELQQLSTRVQGCVRVCASETALVGYLPTVLQSFMRTNPAIVVELEERYHWGVVQALKDGAAEIGILPSDTPLPGIWNRFLFRDQLVAVMNSSHPLAGYPGVTLSEILDYDIVGQDSRSALTALLRKQSMLLGRPMLVAVSADGYDVVCQLAAAGLGIGIVAETSCRLFVAGAQIVGLPDSRHLGQDVNTGSASGQA